MFKMDSLIIERSVLSFPCYINVSLYQQANMFYMKYIVINEG